MNRIDLALQLLLVTAAGVGVWLLLAELFNRRK